MPYYSELGIYTPSSSYTSPLIKGPYSTHSSILASNILPPSSKQFNRSNFRNFKPHLMTISEASNASLPIRRINSPKLAYHSSPKVRVQRPIKINTADIDVSVNRYKKYSPQSKPQKSNSESKSPSPQKDLTPPAEVKEAKPNTAIRRDRATIRLQTIHKDALEKEIGEIRSWRDNFKPEDLVTEAKRAKKTPGELLKEKFLIRSKSKDNLRQLEASKPSRKGSVKKSPSFKDICNEITSDQAIEDLNPGQPVEVRRRQSRQISHDDLLKELHRTSSTLSVEEVHILDALLQAENEVGLHNAPPMIEQQPKSVRKKKVAKKKSSDQLSLEDKKTEKQDTKADVIPDESETNLTQVPVHRRSILKKSSSELSIPDTSATSYTRLRKESSLKNMVKDISQVEIEMIPVKQKPVITGFVGDIEEKNNLKAVIKDLHIQESAKPEKKEKKFRFNVTVEEFPVRKTITVPKYDLKSDNFGIIQLPSSRRPVATSILKKKEQGLLGNIAGDGKEFKKKVEPVDKDMTSKLLKSVSEVQVRSMDENKLQKSGSNDSMINNFTVTVNRAKSNEALAENGETSRAGSNKLKIISIEQSLATVSKINAEEKDKQIAEVTVDSSNIQKSIPKIQTNVSKQDPKYEVKQTDTLLKTTKKELKSDTFLCKTDAKKKDSTPKWAERFRKDQTKSLEETTSIDKNEVPKKSSSVDESIYNDLKLDYKVSENKETPVITAEDLVKEDSNMKMEKALIGYGSKDSSVNLKINNIENDVKEETKVSEKKGITGVAKEDGNMNVDKTSMGDGRKSSSLKTKLQIKNTENDLKLDTNAVVKKETTEVTPEVFAKEESNMKIEKVVVGDGENDSSIKAKPNENIKTDVELDNKAIAKKEITPLVTPKGGEKESNIKIDEYEKLQIKNVENDLKLHPKVTEKTETTVVTPEVTEKKDSDIKVEEDRGGKDSSLKNKLKDLSDEQIKKEDTPKIEPLPKSSAKLRKEEKPAKDENDNQIDFWCAQEEEKYEPAKLDKSKLKLIDPNKILSEIQESPTEPTKPETPEEKERRLISKRSLVYKANKSDPDLKVFEPPTPPIPEPVKSPSPEPSWAPLQSNRLSQWMHPWKKPVQKANCEIEIFAKPKYIRARHIPRRWNQPVVEDSDSEDSTTSEEDSSSEDSEEESEEESEEQTNGEENKVGASTSSSDSGFDSGRVKNNECDVNCHKKCQHLMANLCGVNQKLVVEAIEKVRKGSIDSRDSPGNTLRPASNPAFALDSNDLPEEVFQSSTYQSFQRSGRITPPATTIPRFRKYCVDDFNFLKVLGKGSFGKVLLAELKGTEYYYAIKCLKKDVVLEDDDVECTLIERKVLALGTKHPYLCHLLCTFQTESHLFFVMEYLNGGDLMFHIQVERRFSEARAKFYGAEIVSGLKFLHNKGIVYRDLKLDNILLDFDGHVRIADFGMCKLQIFLDRMADTFCGTPDYMAPEIIKGQHYNQCVDWWSFGVLLYEMLLGQSPFSGCDEDELFWSICNEKPVIPRFLSAEASSVLTQFLEKDANKRLGNRFSPHGDIQDHPFFKPIDWTALENRQLEPPFKPNLHHPLDTQYFDKTFTTERAKLTPIEAGILQSMDQTQFQGFSYTNPNATDK